MDHEDRDKEEKGLRLFQLKFARLYHRFKFKIEDFSHEFAKKTHPYYIVLRDKFKRTDRSHQELQAKSLLRLESFKVQQLMERASEFLEKRGGYFYIKIGVVLLSTFFIADVAGILVSYFVPDPPHSKISSPGGVGAGGRKRPKTLADYDVILARNLFNSSDRKDKPAFVTPDDDSTPAEKTTLPINLIGTIILTDPSRSVATLEDKSNATVYPVRQEDEIPAKIKIIRIEPDRVTFMNLANRKKEYTELPDTAKKSNNPTIKLGAKKEVAGAGIEAVAPNSFVIAKGEVDKALSDINNILTQARAVPNFENGVPNGYKLFQIVPGSIYDKLGLVNGDIILSFNNQALTDPGKAFEQLSELKNMKHLEIQMKRDGKPVTQQYDFQ